MLPRVVLWSPAAVLVGLLLVLGCAGCGAGLVAGVAGSQSGGSSAPPRAPELSLNPNLPLVPGSGFVHTVLVANAALTTSARLSVLIEAAGQSVAQGAPAISGQGGSSAIAFSVETGAIRAVLGDPTAVDVPGRLRVLVEDRDVAPPVPILLLRQLAAALELPPGQSERFVAPSGERVTLRVRGLRHTEAANLQMVVSTRDPEGPPGARTQRVGSSLTVVATAEPDEFLVAALVPGNAFPGQVELSLRDAVSGQSTLVSNAFYRPEVLLALPSQGATTGGSLVTLIGSALVPHAFAAATRPAALDFAAVSLWFRKGGRSVPLPGPDFRIQESGRDRLVFTMPASPDGRPGQVDIVLQAQLEGVVAEVVLGDLFLYANPDPVFAPRGAVLSQTPVAVVPIALDSAPRSDDAPDFAVLAEEAGVAVVQLLLALENGMFQRFGGRRRLGDPESAAERGPRDIASGDFDGDGIPDLLVANAGAATAIHHLVLGQARPLSPLGSLHRIPADPGTRRCLVADFDGDGRDDVLLVPGADAPIGLQPQVRLARPLGQGAPAFTGPILLPVRNFPYEAIEVADLDGDGHLDVAVASGTTLQLDVAYGRGDGGFHPAVPLDFTVPGYVADPRSPAVGLHACRDAAQQSLGLVLAGLLSNPLGSGPTPPVIAVLRQSQPRSFQSPLSNEVRVSPTDPLGVSVAGDLAQAGSLELAVGVRGVPSVASVGLLRFGPAGFQPILGGTETGAELPRNITALHFNRAFPATPLTGEAKALFVLHESLIDNAIEKRLSTRLLLSDTGTQSLVLLPPDAGAAWNRNVEGILGGNFRTISIAGEGSVRDLAIGRQHGIDLLENDGFGGFPRPVGSLDAPDILPGTMLLLPASPGTADRILHADSHSRLHVWRHQPELPSPQSVDASTGALRLLAADPLLQQAALSPATQLKLEDVDGDGIPDLVALLLFDLPAPGAEDGLLLLLRGKPAAGPQEFPFYEPTVALPVHGRSTSLALGDFAAAGFGALRRLEAALAVPFPTQSGGLDGNHVRFYRYQAGSVPSADQFVPSADPLGPQVLIAGDAPTRLAAEDFDGDGLVDLLLIAAGDNSLRLFRNVAPVTGLQGEVAIGQFVESQTARQLPQGAPKRLLLADVNGDGRTDVITVVENRPGGTGPRSTTVSFHLSTGPGAFAERSVVSASRLGDRDAVLSLDVGDWNRDGVLDLFLGWNTQGPQDRNVRVLFGGSR